MNSVAVKSVLILLATVVFWFPLGMLIGRRQVIDEAEETQLTRDVNSFLFTSDQFRAACELQNEIETKQRKPFVSCSADGRLDGCVKSSSGTFQTHRIACVNGEKCGCFFSSVVDLIEGLDGTQINHFRDTVCSNHALCDPLDLTDLLELYYDSN